MLNKHTNSKLETILFLQICYWYDKQQQPFYKFDRPCEHPFCKANDSWQEELDFTYSELNAIRRKSNAWLKANKTYNLFDCGLFVCWKRTSNLTMYAPNLIRISRMEEEKTILQKHFPRLMNWKYLSLNSQLSSSEIVFSHLTIKESLAPYQYTTQNNNPEQNQNKNKKDFSLNSSTNNNGNDLRKPLSEKEKNSAKKEKREASQELIFPFDTIEFKKLWEEWKIYRKEEHGFIYRYKNEQALLTQLFDYDEEFSRNLIITAIANEWKQFLFPNTPIIYQKKSKHDDRKISNSNTTSTFKELYSKYSS